MMSHSRLAIANTGRDPIPPYRPPTLQEGEESDNEKDEDPLCIDEYGEEICLDLETRRHLTPALRARIAGGKIITRKKQTKEEKRRQAALEA